ncbi:MAG: hypothetical protein Q9201_000095 [Fulgogasparrea decipioides]
MPVVLTNYNRSCSEKRKLSPWHDTFVAAKLGRHSVLPLSASRKVGSGAQDLGSVSWREIFKPFHHEPSKQVYLDGAIYHNNPIQIADKERKNLWPSLKTDYPDVFVSIGTSYGRPRRNRELASPPAQVGVVSHGKLLYKIVNDHIDFALDSQKAWEDYISILQPAPEHLTRYVRLNPQLQEDPPSLDEVERMEMLKATVRSQMKNSKEISVLALQLVASCFYFEKSAPAELQSNNSYQCKGEIHCRFLPESDEIYELGKFFKEKMVPDRNPAFIIQEKHRAQEAEATEITPYVIDRMIGKRRFYLGTRPITSTTSRRWAGRTVSRRARQQGWTPPDLGQRPQRTLSSYSQEEHMVGDPNSSALKRFTSLWRNGPNQRRNFQERPAESVEPPIPVETPWGPDDIMAPLRVELDSTPLNFELEGDSTRRI